MRQHRHPARSRLCVTLLLAALLALCLTASCLPAFASEEPSAEAPDDIRIRVFETSDIHGYLMDTSSGDEASFQYRLAYIAQLVNDARTSGEYDDVLLVDGGDIYQGAPVSNLLTGAPLRAAMDAMGYDAVALGNHEFDWGVTAYCADPDGTLPAYDFADYQGDPDIPILASDLCYADTGERVEFTKDYVIVEKAGHRIALVGYIPDYSPQVLTERIADYTIEADLSRLIARVREINETEQPDVTVVVAHEAPQRIAAALDPADVQLVTGGHVHAGVYGVADSGVPYIQADANAKGYASATIVLAADGAIRVEDPMYTNITLDRAALLDTEENAGNLDETVLAISHAAWDALRDDMSEVLGYIDTSISAMGALSDNGASTGGNWFTGLMLRATQADGVVAAFYNSGGIRAGAAIPAGETTRELTVGDVYAIAPFGNTWLVYEITGAELAQHLVNGLIDRDYGDQMSGLTFTYRNLGTLMAPEIVIDSITLDDGTAVDPLDGETLYRVCVSSYSATKAGSVFENLEPVFPEAEAPIDNITMITLLREEARDNEGFIAVDTSARGVCLEGPTGSGEPASGEPASVEPASAEPDAPEEAAESDVVLSDDASDFVLLSEAVPDAILEIRYYSTYNFVGDRIDGYEEPVALLTREAAEALREVSDDLMECGYRLKIYDAYRPQMAVTNFMNWALDTDDTRMKEFFYPELEKDVLFPLGYIAEHSGHSRGSTVDLTLFDMTTEKEVDMGGTFDWFGELSHPDYEGVTEEQYENRMLLREAMLAHGFKPLAEEWWHFTLEDEPYPDTYFTFPVSAASLARSPEPARRKVIIDTDVGADDAAALLLAAQSDELDILGVTVLYGNVALENAANGALTVLELCGCDAPVYIGADKPLVKERPEMFFVHGEDGLGDQDLVHPQGKPAEGDAVDFILDTVRADPGEVEIIALGPLTNIARAVEKDPETMGLVKRIWVMGTAGFGAGNATPVAEFNVYNDAEAYDVVLRSGLPLTVVGLDCMEEETRVSREDMDAMAAGNEYGRFMSKAFTKLFALYQDGGSDMGVPDALAVAAAIWPDYVLETVPCYGVACVDDNAAYGQVILYREDAVYESLPEVGGYNLEVVSAIDAPLYKERFMEVMTGGDALDLWTEDAEARQALVSYMEAITDESSADYIPPEDRIAVFDLDGTLFCETDPVYFDHCLLVYRVMEDPEYRDLASDFERETAARIQEWMQGGDYPEGMDEDHGRAVASAFAGMSLEEFNDYIQAFKQQPMPGYEGLNRGDGWYLPMLQVVDYLQENGFAVYIVSGTDRLIVRGLVDGSPLDLPAWQIIGSDETIVTPNQGDTDGLSYVYDENDQLVLGGEFLIKNLKMNKVAVIAQEIGRQPVLSFGNSTGDSSMAEYVTSGNPYRSLAFMLCCDDTERENGSEEKAAKMYGLCEEFDWVPVSMKNDWTTIYGDGVTKR